jgi:hypothetical protein
MGNKYVRSVVVEACQYATRPITVSKVLRARRKGVDEGAIKIADRCMQRIYKKGSRLAFKGKHTNKIKCVMLK